MIYILDTDHLTIADQDTAEGIKLNQRLAAVPPDAVTVTVINYEEQMRGWLAYIARARTTARQVEAYRRLRRHIELFRRVPILDFDEQAAAEFDRLRQAGIRIGAMDLKIAAIALVHDATLLTRNRTDFGKVPGLRVEDWTL